MRRWLTKCWPDKPNVCDAILDFPEDAPGHGVIQRRIDVSLGNESERLLIPSRKNDNIRPYTLLHPHNPRLRPIILLKMNHPLLVNMSRPRRQVNLPPTSRPQLHINEPCPPPVEPRLAPVLLRDVRQRPVALADEQRVRVQPHRAHPSHPLVEPGPRARDAPRHVGHEGVVDGPQPGPALYDRRYVGRVEQGRRRAVERLVGVSRVGPAAAPARAEGVRDDLGRGDEAVAVAEDDAPGRGCYGQVGYVHCCLADA